MSTTSTTSSTTSGGAALQTISGLASGIDTSAVISALMGVASLPKVAIQNQITVETARQTAYNDVLNEVNQLTTAYQALTDVTTWAPVQSASSSDSSSVSATLTAGAAAGAYTVGVTQLARANQFTSSGGSSAAAADTIHIATAAGTTNVNIAAGDSLSTIATKINQTTGTPVYATVFNGNLVLSNMSTGTAAAITGVTTNGTSGLSFAETQTAKDANFTIDSTAYTSGSNTVTTAMAGVTLQLSALTSGTTISVGAPQADTSDIESKLNAFVTQYNSTITDIENRLTTAPVSNPQTDADRAVGVLYGDSGLERLLSNLRNSFSDLQPNGNQYTSLAQIGLSTGAAVGSGTLNDNSINGLLTVDTTTFENALNTNFTAVKALFTNATNSYTTEGLGQRLNGILSQYTLPSAAGGYLPSEIDNETNTIKDLQSQVSDWTQRLALKQTMYENEFTQMETALSQAQSVGSQLSSQIAQLG
jgi:flagellar hook-associated protein 2